MLKTNQMQNIQFQVILSTDLRFSLPLVWNNSSGLTNTPELLLKQNRGQTQAISHRLLMKASPAVPCLSPEPSVTSSQLFNSSAAEIMECGGTSRALTTILRLLCSDVCDGNLVYLKWTKCQETRCLAQKDLMQFDAVWCIEEERDEQYKVNTGSVGFSPWDNWSNAATIPFRFRTTSAQSEKIWVTVRCSVSWWATGADGLSQNVSLQNATKPYPYSSLHNNTYPHIGVKYRTINPVHLSHI